ncbi:ComEA family DNA-binding protein [bacterium]|jgi:competence protein ComEA|nr:ComEA family DNA-binding protein [bacterium]
MEKLINFISKFKKELLYISLLLGSGMSISIYNHYLKPIPSGFIEIKPIVQEQQFVTIHIHGAVKHPGVYKLDASSRLINLITLAGGPKKDADLSSLNLAKSLSDGQKFQIPFINKEKTNPSSFLKKPASPIVNINNAPKNKLTTLPGIGPSTAQKIIDYREKKGGFRTLKDMLKIKGIGPKSFVKIEEMISL